MMENRNGLLVETLLTEANGRAERDAALLMAEALPPGKRDLEGRITTPENSWRLPR